MNSAIISKRTLHVEEGQHYILEPDEELPYRLRRNLGHGGCANVEEVEDQYTGMIFARKVFRIGGSSVERKRICESFENEVKVIRRLAPHHHITRVFATYVGRREIGILLTPVADRGSLDTFLLDAHEGHLTQTDMNILYCSFGCLANGLQFMHAQKIRHKDIKPQNILVHDNKLIYTDFGSSLDYSAATRSVTTGPSYSTTRRYAAPELRDSSPRSSRSDIFSLGCVYLEILSALILGPLDVELTPYRDHIETILTRMREASHSCDTWILVVIRTACQMLSIEPGARPSAETITKELWMCWPSAFCDDCCMSLPIYTQARDLPILTFDISTVRSSRSSQDIPVFNDMCDLQGFTRNIVDVSQMDSLLHQQSSVPQLEQWPRCSAPQPSVDPLYPATTSLSPEHMEASWSPLLSIEAVLNNSQSSLPWEPYNHGISQPSSELAEDYPSDVADSGESLRSFSCPKCAQISVSQSEHKKHMLKHDKRYRCSVAGCRRTEGFASPNDRDRHMRSVHRQLLSSTSYQCAAEQCRVGYKIWPRLDNFKQHIERMHGNEDVSDLIERSTTRPREAATITSERNAA